MHSRPTLPEWDCKRRILGLGNLGNSSPVILTAIVMMPDKNFQFLRQTRFKRGTFLKLDPPWLS
jgi:hypothetical protein